MPTVTEPIQMVNLTAQYQALKEAIDATVLDTLATGQFIGGTKVKRFEQNLNAYVGSAHTIACANGTDALQIALMALDLQPGDEIIVPAFTYVSTAEVIGLMRLQPVMVDVDPDSFNLTDSIFRAAITPRTRAVVPVHLYGQSADMEPILATAREAGIRVIEDNAQAIGAVYTFSDGRTAGAGTMGDVGTTSFYPSKNLGAFGDGGALFAQEETIASTLRSIANHGQAAARYYHDRIGVNSRLDALQAGILDIKLAELDNYCAARRAVASQYDAAFRGLSDIEIPYRQPNSTHVFHQYTLKVKNGRRDALKAHLQQLGIPSMIYYPVPLYRQRAYQTYWDGRELPVTETLCKEVISLPMHTELSPVALTRIIDGVNSFFE